MNKISYISFYLPQYHTIPENDRWWGEGFTEWVRVKNSFPLFNGHYQPRVPYEYYDLTDVGVMISQAALARQFGISGFCYYHYWFNGRLLLEKPVEQMLSCKDVNIPFCLCWANEQWTRAWSGKSKEILMPQEYGDEKEWENHLDYLIPFFKDERYIKINGKYIFLVYRTASFSGFDRMIDHWNGLLKKKGLPGLFMVEMLTSFQKNPTCRNSEGVVEFEPMFTIGEGYSFISTIKSGITKRLRSLKRNQYRLFDYDRVWEKILARDKSYDRKVVFPGAFTDWDNSPRFNRKAALFKNVTPEKFSYYLARQTRKSGSEYLFINAWNEWAEGAYLEPDGKNGTRFLEAVKRVHDGFPG